MSYPIHVLVHGFFSRPRDVSDVVISITKTRPEFKLLVSCPGVLVGVDLFEPPRRPRVPTGSDVVLRYTGLRYGDVNLPEIIPPPVDGQTKWVLHKASRTPRDFYSTTDNPWWDLVHVRPRIWYSIRELPLAWAHADAGSWANPVGFTVSPSRTPEWEAYDKAIQSAWSAQFKPGGAGEAAPPGDSPIESKGD